MYLIVGKTYWILKYSPYTKGAKYDRAIAGYDFDQVSYEVEGERYFLDVRSS